MNWEKLNPSQEENARGCKGLRETALRRISTRGHRASGSGSSHSHRSSEVIAMKEQPCRDTFPYQEGPWLCFQVLLL